MPVINKSFCHSHKRHKEIALRILLFSRYENRGSSSRLRFYQFLPYLQSRGIHVYPLPLFKDDYLTALYSGKISISRILRSYIARIYRVLRENGFDLIWLEKELLPWLPWWLEFVLLPRHLPIIVDYDDAVFHRYDTHRFSLVRGMLGKKIDEIMRRADIVVVGNEYLWHHAEDAGARRIELLPTVVDTDRYTFQIAAPKRLITIGWIGSPSTTKHLRIVSSVLKEIVSTHRTCIIAVGANAEQLKDLPVEVRPWSEETEVREILQFDIGIMPLPDGSFERGKCGYKLIQYMACGKPVVASPVGANRVIVHDGTEGFLTKDYSEWFQALGRLIRDHQLRARMGISGRKRVEEDYSLRVVGPKLHNLLCSVESNSCVA